MSQAINNFIELVKREKVYQTKKVSDLSSYDANQLLEACFDVVKDLEHQQYVLKVIKASVDLIVD